MMLGWAIGKFRVTLSRGLSTEALSHLSKTSKTIEHSQQRWNLLVASFGGSRSRKAGSGEDLQNHHD